MQPGPQFLEETATAGLSVGLMRLITFHDAVGYGDAFIANVDLPAGD